MATSSSKSTVRVVFAFGLNEDGQCGRSVKKNQTEFYMPVTVKFAEPLVRIVSVSAGSRHSLALSENGHVYSWGWGRVGQLGLGDSHSISHPTRLNLEEIVTISAGGMHSACIDTKNTCYCWGSNSSGQLGLGKGFGVGLEFAVHLPTVVAFEDSSEEASLGPLLVQKVNCGGLHTASIGLNGELYCWGKADSGQLGISTWYLDFDSVVYFPKRVQGLPSPAVDVACGGFYTLVLTSRHAVYAMGKEDFGCLGTGIELSNMSIGMETPTLIQALDDKMVAAVAAGGWHSCFKLQNGQVNVCGKGEYGRLGLGNERSVLEPTPITTTRDGDAFGPIEQVSAGGSHTLFLSQSNSILSAGRVDCGRCGIQLGEDRLVLPQDVSSRFFAQLERRFIQVSAGGTHSLVIAEYTVDGGEEGVAVDQSVATSVTARVQAFQMRLFQEK